MLCPSVTREWVGKGELSKERTQSELAKALRGQGRQRSDDKSRGAQLLKSKVSVRKEVHSEECHSAVEVDLPIVKKGTQIQGNE
ncbi:hypothetical protein BHM03_00058800 [Ensete ventricosum]|nr:hypothetical protein BHM03_00058800 [Ensete ventricosum]